MVAMIRAELWPEVASPAETVRVRARLERPGWISMLQSPERVRAVLERVDGHEFSRDVSFDLDSGIDTATFTPASVGAHPGVYVLRLKGSRGADGPALPLIVAEPEERAGWSADFLSSFEGMPELHLDDSGAQPAQLIRATVDAFKEELWRRGRIERREDVRVRVRGESVSPRALLGASAALSLLTDITRDFHHFDLAVEAEGGPVLLRLDMDMGDAKSAPHFAFPRVQELEGLNDALQHELNEMFPAFSARVVDGRLRLEVTLPEEKPFGHGTGVAVPA